MILRSLFQFIVNIRKSTVSAVFLWIVAGCSTNAPSITNEFQHNSSPVFEESIPSEEQDTEQSYEPVVAQQNDDLWLKIIELYQLDTDFQHPRIQAQYNYYKKHPAYMQRVAKRGERYLYYITSEVEINSVPGEIALLPIVESAFDPFAYSHGRASGVWQFIPSTGRAFGLQQDWWHDGRRDIRASTSAAITYLTRLSRQFDGDWLLALAGYNAGAGNVRKAIRKNKKLGKPTDFWSLDLPKETKAYVPKLLALAKLIKDYQTSDTPLQAIPNEPYFGVVSTNGQIDLSQVAELAKIELDEVYRLNPSFNQWATRPDGPHEILLPINSIETFKNALAQLQPEQRVKWQRYKILSGDTISTIAQKFKTTSAVVQEVNNLDNSKIIVGKTLVIPTAFKKDQQYTYAKSNRVKRIQQRRRPKHSEQVSYKVLPGDSFWKIAQENNVTVSSLARWNNLAPGDPLRVGQKLVIYSNQPQSKANKTSNRGIIRKINYTVRNGDSLSTIANRFKVNVRDLINWNSVKTEKYLQPGQRLTLFVDVTR